MAAVNGVTFDRTGFEAGIRQAMQMGLPADPTDQPIFYFQSGMAVTGTVDGRGVPFSPTAPTAATGTAPVSGIVCGIAFGAHPNQETRIGDLADGTISITMLDAEYQQVRDCTYMLLGGVFYDRGSTDAPVSLFTAPVWTTRWTERGGKVGTK